MLRRACPGAFLCRGGVMKPGKTGACRPGERAGREKRGESRGSLALEAGECYNFLKTPGKGERMDSRLNGKISTGRGGGKLMHIELMRALCITAVLLYHSKAAQQLMQSALPHSAQFRAGLVLQLALGCCIFPFFMISGALLLERDESPGQIFRKRVLKTLAVLLLISLFYYFFYSMNGGALRPVYFAELVYSSSLSVQLWFLYAYLGFLLMLPLLRPMAQYMQNRHFIYLFGLALIFRVLLPFAECFLMGEQYRLNEELLLPAVFCDVIFFPLMGYYIEKRLPERYYTKKNAFIAVSGAVIMLILTAAAAELRSELTGESGMESAARFRFAVILPLSTSLYFALKCLFVHREAGKRTVRLLSFLGGCSFGIFLFESALRQLMLPLRTALETLMPPFPAALIWAAAVYLTGLAGVGLLRLIPGIKKFI